MNQKRSIFQIVLLAIFGALAVAAVLIFSLAVGGQNQSSTGPVRIWGTLDASVFNQVIREASENLPQLAQVAYEQKDPDTYVADITNALASGQGPDLFLIRQDQAYLQAPKLVPIPEETINSSQFEDTFVEAASPFASASGILAFPLAVDPLVLYWNRDMLSTAGYAKPPAHWDEIYDMSQKITRRNDAGVILKSTIGFGEYRNVNNAKNILSMLIMQVGGSITAREEAAGRIVSTLGARSGESGNASMTALRFFTEFADPSTEWYTWNRSLPETRQAFAAGDLALYIGLASEGPLIARMNPNLNFAAAPIPQIRNATRAVDTGFVYGFAIPRTSQNPGGALTVAFTLSSAELSKTISEQLSMSSARRDILAQPAQGTQDLFNKQAIITRSWVDPDPAKTDAVFRSMVENTTSGAVLLPEAVSRADQEMSQIFGI